MSQWLKQNTAVTIKMGAFVDSTDGVTAETALTISQADIRLSKNGGAFAQTNNVAGATHDENGYYGVPLDTTDTNTLGTLRVAISESGALPVWHDFMVVPANVYDSLIAGSDTLQADLTQMGGVAQSATDLKDFADTGYDPATNKVEGVKLVDTTTTNTDMVGTNSALLAASAPANFGDLAITVTTGKVTVGTNDDKTGYGLTTATETQIDAIETDTNEMQGKLPTNNIMGSSVKTDKDDEIDTIKTATDKLGFDGSNYVNARVKATDDIDLSATQKASVNSEVDNALNTAIPGSPTADSISERVKAIDDKLPSKSYLAGSANTDGDIQMDEATGNFPGSVASVAGAVGSVTGNVGGNVTGSVGSLATQAKADVQAEAEDAIEVKLIVRTNTAQAGGANTITLDTGASPTNDWYVNQTVFILSGTGAGQSRKVSSYVGATKVVTVDSNWATNPDNTSIFIIFPNYILTGSGATAAEVWAYATRILTANTNLNDPSATAIRTEMDDNSTKLANLDATVSSRSSHAAADVWSVGTRTLTSFGTLLTDIWNRLSSALTTTGSIGKLLVDNVNATISSRSSHSAPDLTNLDAAVSTRAVEANVETHVTNSLNTYDPPTKSEMDAGFVALNDPTAAAVATAVVGKVVDGTIDVTKALKIIVAYCAGDIAKSGNTYTYKDQSAATLITEVLSDSAADRTIA